MVEKEGIGEASPSMGCEGKGGVQADSQVPVQGRGLCDEGAILKVGNVGKGSGVGERCWLQPCAL